VDVVYILRHYLRLDDKGIPVRHDQHEELALDNDATDGVNRELMHNARFVALLLSEMVILPLVLVRAPRSMV